MTGRGASAGAAPGRRRVILGAALVAAAGLMFALAGMGIKMAEESLSSFEVLFWRNVLSLAILTPWVLWHWPRSMRPAHRGLMAMRGVALVAALLCYYHAVSVLPLAEAVLLNFSAPIFVPVLGFLLFRFALDGRVLAAVLIGFAGVALILKPGTEFFQPAALIGAASGVLGGLSAVAIWRMPTDENPIRIAVYFALIGILVTLTPVLMDPTLPPAEAWPGLIMLGVFSTAAHVLFAKGSLIAPTDRVGTFIYTAVVFAAVFGWLFWDEGVDWLMAGGAVLIVAAGVIAIRAGRPRPASDDPQTKRYATVEARDRGRASGCDPKGDPADSVRHGACDAPHRAARRSALSAGQRRADHDRSDHGHAAVDVERLPGDVAGLLAREVDAGGGDVAPLAEAPGGDRGEQGLLLRVRQRVGHRRLDESGGNAVGGDAARGCLGGERLHHPREAGLGGGVVGLPGIAGRAHHRGDEDEPPPTLAEHAAQAGAGEHEAGAEIDVQDLLPVLVLHAERETVAGDSAAMDEDGGRTCRLRRAFGQGREGGAIGEIAGHRMGALAQPRSQRLQRIRAPAGERHCRPLAVKGLGDGSADTARCARDQRHLSRQIEHPWPLPAAAACRA